MKHTNAKEMLIKLVGLYAGLHRMPLATLGDHTENRVLSLWWLHVKKYGVPSLADGRTDRRTIDELLERGLLKASGSTKDRLHGLTTEGIYTAWALSGDTPSILKDALQMVNDRISKNAVTFEKDICAFPFNRKAGFPPVFTALELLGLVKIGFATAYATPEAAYYAIQPTGKKIIFPEDSAYPQISETHIEAFSHGLQMAEDIASRPLPKCYGTELGGLTVYRIKSFATEKQDKDFQNAKGLFKLDY